MTVVETEYSRLESVRAGGPLTIPVETSTDRQPAESSTPTMAKIHDEYASGEASITTCSSFCYQSNLWMPAIACWPPSLQVVLTGSPPRHDRIPHLQFDAPFPCQAFDCCCDMIVDNEPMQRYTTSPLPGSSPPNLAPWPEHEPQQAAWQRAALADDSLRALPPVSEGMPSPSTGPADVSGRQEDDSRSGRVRRINADVSDALLHRKGLGVNGGDTAYREGAFWDVEKGGGDSASSAASEDEEVDFMGGFSVNSNFDPNVDVYAPVLWHPICSIYYS